MRSSIKRLIAVATLVAVAVATYPYDPPTDDELSGWWDSLSREERLAELRKLDEVEHAEPEVDGPTLVVVEERDGTIHAFWSPEPVMTVRVAGYLEYEIDLPTARVPGSVNLPAALRWGAIGFVAGAATLCVAWLASR